MQTHILCLVIAGLISFAAIGCHSAGSTKSSPEMMMILKRHQIDKWELDVQGLKSTSNDEIPTTASADFKIHKLPINSRYADSFHYQIVLKKRIGIYWIIRIGGVAGSTTTYGPLKLGPNS